MDAPTDEEAMAQAMGFSSFGTNRPQKRKYNPQADAVVDAKRNNNKAVSTGSNSTPLGTGAYNANEITLDDEVNNGDEPAPEAEAEEAVAVPATQEANAADSAPQEAPVRPAGLPARPAPGAGFMGPSRGHQGGHQGGHANASGSKRPWYEEYYDPSSNENPWQRLEVSLDLQPLGTWLEREQKATVPA
ncbi:hypothetical protein PT974_02602 [Cladobotryum mycophilum]|uniref:Uncharacterized protein n=1 Tax=Cladobotryum mycophilum TaxID=491253 RepID=A0ABR0SYN4_9HYPO